MAVYKVPDSVLIACRDALYDSVKFDVLYSSEKTFKQLLDSKKRRDKKTLQVIMMLDEYIKQ